MLQLSKPCLQCTRLNVRSSSITRRDVLDLLDGIVDRGSPTMANRTLAYVRRLFNWCIERGIIGHTPLFGVKPPAKTVARDRILEDVELVEVWLASEAVGWPFGDILKLLTLTAVRRDEAAQAIWSEFDLEAAEWTIPSERSKNAKAHVVPLSSQVVTLLAEMPKVERQKGVPAYVFTTNGRTPYQGFGKSKAALDRAISAARSFDDRSDDKAMPAWRLHDIRRTVASGMARLGHRSEVIERILNHVHPGGSALASVYQRYEHGPEMRAALEDWGRHVAGLLDPTECAVALCSPRGAQEAV